MSTYNTTIIVGRLGKDPEPRQTNTGKTVLNLSVATERFAGSEEAREKVTDWHRVTVFGQPADFLVQYATKGDTILVEGPLVYNEFTGNDGVTRRTSEIMASRVKLLSSRRSGNGSHSADRGNHGRYGSEHDAASDGDDIPF